MYSTTVDLLSALLKGKREMTPLSIADLVSLMPSECVVCHKPLGADTKAEGFTLCHEHRVCCICKENAVTSTEAKFCINKFISESEEKDLTKLDFLDMEVYHVRCNVIANHEPIATITQTHLDYLNIIRLMIEPNPNLNLEANIKNAVVNTNRFISQLDTYEKKVLHHRMIEAVYSETTSILGRDKKFREEKKVSLESDKIKKATPANATKLEVVKPTKETLSSESL